MSTSYICDRDLAVTQTFVYVDGELGFVARYAVTNLAATPLTFGATCRGVFTAAGSRVGQGFLDAASPRTIGVFNDAQGSDGGFVEASSTPWTRFMEAALPLGSPYEPGESALFGELSNTVDPSLVSDPRAVLEFGRYASFGLAPGATDTFDVNWFFGHYDGLSLSPLSGSQPVGQARSVAVTSLNHGQPVSGGTVRYAIAGVNPSSGVVATAADGTATITWFGRQPGQDTLTAYIDSDNNGAFDPAIDTQQTATFSWVDAPAPAPPPPPPPPPPLPPALSRPSNRFSVLAVRPSAGGVIRLTLSAHAPGRYRALATSRRSTKGTFAYGNCRAATKSAGRVTLTIRPTPAAKRRLRRASTRVTIAITFTPTGGAVHTKHRTVAVRSNKRR